MVCYCGHTLGANVAKIQITWVVQQGYSYRICRFSLMFCTWHSLSTIDLNLYVGQTVNNNLPPFVYRHLLPPSCPLGDSPSTTGPRWPPANDFSARTEEIYGRLWPYRSWSKQTTRQPLVLSGLCVHVRALTASLKPRGRRWRRERGRAAQWETQWLMAFPQGLHFLQLTTRREEPRGSGH